GQDSRQTVSRKCFVLITGPPGPEGFQEPCRASASVAARPALPPAPALPADRVPCLIFCASRERLTTPGVGRHRIVTARRPSMVKLVLLRHGESTWNLENRFTGWTDVDL